MISLIFHILIHKEPFLNSSILIKGISFETTLVIQNDGSIGILPALNIEIFHEGRTRLLLSILGKNFDPSCVFEVYHLLSTYWKCILTTHIIVKNNSIENRWAISVVIIIILIIEATSDWHINCMH